MTKSKKIIELHKVIKDIIDELDNIRDDQTSIDDLITEVLYILYDADELITEFTKKYISDKDLIMNRTKKCEELQTVLNECIEEIEKIRSIHLSNNQNELCKISIHHLDQAWNNISILRDSLE